MVWCPAVLNPDFDAQHHIIQAAELRAQYARNESVSLVARNLTDAELIAYARAQAPLNALVTELCDRLEIYPEEN